MCTIIKLLKIKDAFEGKKTDEALLWQALYQDYENECAYFLTHVYNKEAIVSKLMKSTSVALVEDNYKLTDNIVINIVIKILYIKKILGLLVILLRGNTVKNYSYYCKQLDALFFELGKKSIYSHTTPITEYLFILTNFREESQLDLIEQTINRINLSIATR